MPVASLKKTARRRVHGWRLCNGTRRVSQHPGVYIQECLDAKGWSQTDLANTIGMSRKHVSLVCNAHAPVSVDMALALELVLGKPARLFCEMQVTHDIELARKANVAKLNKIKKSL